MENNNNRNPLGQIPINQLVDMEESIKKFKKYYQFESI